jgi:hypothetical protein
MEYMERIIKHFIGDVPCDTQNLQRIAETLKNEILRPPCSITSITNEESDDAEHLEIADEKFTLKELSDNTARESDICCVLTRKRLGSQDADYSGEFSHWSFSKRVQQRIDTLLAGTDPVQCLLFYQCKEYADNLQVQHEIGTIKEHYRAKNLQSSGSTLFVVAQWFPPQPVSEFLISSFFKYGQTNYYYVEEDWAMAKLESIYSQTSSTSSDDSPAWCILLMLLAIGTQFADLDSADITAAEQTNDTSSGHSFSPEDDVGLSFYRFAVQLIPDVITIASIESVQAFLLLGVYTLPLDTPGLSYTYLGVAIKMAIQNGMHRKYSGVGLDRHTVEIRNRLWWTVYTLEK